MRPRSTSTCRKFWTSGWASAATAAMTARLARESISGLSSTIRRSADPCTASAKASTSAGTCGTASASTAAS